MTVSNFILNGRRYELDSDVVSSLLAEIDPEPIREHAVLVGERWYPVRQAFERAVGLRRSEFTSHAARRHLSALGFEMRGEITHRDEPTHGVRSASVGIASPPAAPSGWPSEAAVQSQLVRALVSHRWHILSVANTATKERGVDVVANRGDETVGVEVKGFPSKDYADPRRSGEVKKTRPSTQAGHWYAQAVLAAMRLRSKQSEWRSVIALPSFPRYRDLFHETSGSLTAAQIEVWWVEMDGSVRTSRGGGLE